ncbi:putative colanic acid biosynthesis acetyltransferase [bacterium]|jgi:putative colanic acid biosynthesis acetyltransferase WcaF|nr:putative colanic acid biosynthesis acetyltransferase [bacterium]
MANRFDISQNKSPHSLMNKVGRTLWGLVYPILFRPSPKIFHGWRRMILRLFGANLHPTAKVFSTAKIWAPWNLTMEEYSCISFDVDCYNVAPIRLGPHSTVSQYSFLCTASHDMNDPGMRLTTAPISIGAGTWVCADVFVAPGVTIGDGTVVGARSSVFGNIPANKIAAGNPCRIVRDRGEPPSPGKEVCVT